MSLLKDFLNSFNSHLTYQVRPAWLVLSKWRGEEGTPVPSILKDCQKDSRLLPLTHQYARAPIWHVGSLCRIQRSMKVTVSVWARGALSMHTGETTSPGEASSGWSGDVVGSGHLGSWQGPWALVICPGTAPWKARWDPSHCGSPGSGSRLV